MLNGVRQSAVRFKYQFYKPRSTQTPTTQPASMCLLSSRPPTTTQVSPTTTQGLTTTETSTTQPPTTSSSTLHPLTTQLPTTPSSTSHPLTTQLPTTQPTHNVTRTFSVTNQPFGEQHDRSLSALLHHVDDCSALNARFCMA